MTSDRTIALSTTVSKMRSQQLYQTLKRKAKSTIVPRLPISLDKMYQPRTSPNAIDFTVVQNTNDRVRNAFIESDQSYFQQQLESFKQGSLTFLNRSVETGDHLPSSINPLIGQNRGFPRLWTLKLLSFEPGSWLVFFSDDEVVSVVKTLVAWLKSWEEHDITTIGNKNYLRQYWTPYTVSRRIGNLAIIGAALGNCPDESTDIVSEHLAKNVKFLCDHVEYDIGGNHLLENGCALVVGGVLLDDECVISKGRHILSSELSSQLLDDGMHFERSPMYHSILLYRITWCLDILSQSGRELPPDIVSHVRSMYICLQNFAPGEANYPLLNDSVYRESPSRQSCLSFVEHVIDMSSMTKSDGLSGKSGYYTIESDPATVLVDGGVPCPDHLPAHAHNDLGNVVLWMNEVPIITDTGVYDYQPGNRRDYARSVGAHNTIQVDESDQTVTHGRFMMGPRPTPQSGYVNFGSELGVTVQYDSPKFVRSYTHNRLVKPINRGVQIEDRVFTNGRSVTSRIHLAPEINAVSCENTINMTTNTGEEIDIVISGIDSLDVIETEYYPQYGVSVKRPTIEAIHHSVNNEACITHKIYCHGTKTDE